MHSKNSTGWCHYLLKEKYLAYHAPKTARIVYKAAVEEIEKGEAEKLHCDTMILKKGKYISTTIHDYMTDIQSIGCTFRDMLLHNGLDPQGYCVEWYLNDKDVKCMIRLEE